MKAFAAPCGILTILFLVFSCLIFSPMKAQTIQIDRTFSSDGEIFPFSPNDTIYGLSISGSVTLSSDTSLVRVILTDNSGNEWMVYEAYPMIVTDTAFEIVEECDETYYLEESIPHSLSIQTINAEITLDHLTIHSNQYQNLTELQLQAKRNKDLSKMQDMNQYIISHNWNWTAGITGVVNLFYKDKVILLGSRYNALGLDYYSGGYYRSVYEENDPGFTETTLVQEFDWRKKHNAHLASSEYFVEDAEDPSNGWITGPRVQICGSCAAFATIASLEAVINLYANYHYDLIEQTRFSERDAYNCSKFDYVGKVGCDCNAGKPLSVIMEKIQVAGVVSEECYPREDEFNYPYCEAKGDYYNSCSEFSHKCIDPRMTAQICGESLYSLLHEADDQPERAAFLKQLLIKNGPFPVVLIDWPESNYQEHAVSLIGFETDNDGGLWWIIKNSWPEWGENGFGKRQFWLGSSPPEGEPSIGNTIHTFNFDDTCQNPITVICHQPENCNPNFSYHVHDYDKDKDGYYNWGIGPRIKDHPPCYVEEEDSNDDDKRIGPYEEDYSGESIKPEMQLLIGAVNPTPISNHGFYFFNANPEDFTFRIVNPGSAMLHMDPFSSQNGVVSISGDDASLYKVNHQPSKNELCMFGDETDFSINFTTVPGDGRRIAYIKIGVLNIDKDILEDFEFALVFNGCNAVEEDLIVNGYLAKTEYELMPRDIYIERNGILEVFGSLAMFEESDIFVKPGGQLIINGGVITGITGDCTTLWHGIDIWGDPRLPQVLNYQGKVSVINGGRIEYAEIAIETAHHDPDPRRWYPTGGIISCVDAVFKDNITDIRMNPFRNLHPNGFEIPNMSRFKRTKFVTTDDFYTLFHEELYTHIYFDGVGGINVMGCTFENNSTRSNVFRGKGIESYGAGYFVFKACSQDNLPECPGVVPSRFENLDYGIRAFNSNSYATIKVDSVDFFHNRRGIHMILVDNPTIIKSNFEVSDPEGFWPGGEFVGLYLDQSTTGFVVEENIFNGPSTLTSTVGIHLLNTGTDQNEIYNNSFSSLYHGISAVGVNRLSDKESQGVGLCIKCNDFQQCRNDIYVTCETDDQGNEICTINSGIAQKQGVMNESEPFYNTLAAGNTFSDVNSANYFNNDHCGHIDYTYHGDDNPSDAKIVPVPVYGDINRQGDYRADYTKAASCPSHLGGSITLTMEKSILTTETNLISAYEDTLQMEIDGGNTEGLNFEVLTSFPEEALVIRQELIEESPFLSDTVMISAIEKEDVLPGAMIRDILVQNPQSPKSNNVMDALDQRQDSIPDYMMEEIMQGLNTYGAKELLEQELGNHVAKRDLAWKNLNLFYKNDTSNISNAIDSLIELQETDYRLSTRYDLAFMNLYIEDSINSFSVLNDIPSVFDLSAQEVSTHSRYLELFDILWDVKNDTLRLDSLQIQILFDLADSYQTIPGLYASNLLIKEGLLNYKEPVYLADPVKNTPVLNKIQETSAIVPNLSLFPNPAGNYFIAYYYLSEQQNPGILTISDINGRELKAIQLKDKNNQIVIPTQELFAGVYIVSLIGRNHLIESQKVTIIK